LPARRRIAYQARSHEPYGSSATSSPDGGRSSAEADVRAPITRSFSATLLGRTVTYTWPVIGSPDERARYHSCNRQQEQGVPMTAEEHFRKAEQLAAKASEYLGHGDGQDSAAVWAAVAQVHATLALAAAFERPQTGSTSVT